MKIAHISDSHFDERGRLEDVAQVHEAFVKQATQRRVDLILHTGDMFERKSTPAERLEVAEFLIAAAAVCPVVVVRGNHDQPGDLALFRELEAAHPIYVADEKAEVFEFDTWCIACLPWFDKAYFMARGGLADGRRDANEAARALFATLACDLRSGADKGLVPLVAAHLMVGGSETSTGQLLIGDGIETTPSDLAHLGASYVALGHIHKTQQWYAGRIAYAGSPHRQNFGEIEEKGWRLVEILPGHFTNEFVKLPARERVLIERDFTAETVPFFDPRDVVSKGALVRYRYRIRAQDLHKIEEGAIRESLLAAGAEEVQIEAVVEPELRAREPLIVECETTENKVRLWLDTKKRTVSDTFWDKLVEVER